MGTGRTLRTAVPMTECRKMTQKERKNLTARYSVTQFVHWISATGTTSFATAYLLERGLSSSLVGTLLAAAGLLSCLTQPVLASAADRAKRFVLIRMQIVTTLLCCVCLMLQFIPGLPVLFAGALYMAGVFSSDTMTPLMNALSVACNGAGYPVNYGAARGIGSAASAISAFAAGHILADFGAGWMLAFLLLFRLACVLSFLGYPHIEKTGSVERGRTESCSVREFFLRYRWYCVSLLGVLCMGMYLAMTENYMIAIMGRLGGDSGNVGTALFLSSMAGAPVIFFFGRVRRCMKDTLLLKVAALTFLLRAVLVCFAARVEHIYLIQLLQVTSYGFLGPVQVYYAGDRVRPCDMVKGQAFITAAYALGCSMGNFTGGQLLNFGVDAILHAGVLMALCGVLVIFLTVERRDRLSD